MLKDPFPVHPYVGEDGRVAIRLVARLHELMLTLEAVQLFYLYLLVSGTNTIGPPLYQFIKQNHCVP